MESGRKITFTARASISSKAARPTRELSGKVLRTDMAFITTIRGQPTTRGGGGMTRKTGWGSSAVRMSITTGSGGMGRRKGRCGDCRVEGMKKDVVRRR